MRSKCGESFVVNRMKFDRIDDDRIVNEFVYRRVCVLITVCLRFDRSQSAGSAMIFCLQKKKSDVDTESGPQRQDIYCEVYLITWTNQGNKPDSVFLSVLISLDNNDSRSEVSNQNRLVQLVVELNVWQVGRSYNLSHGECITTYMVFCYGDYWWCPLCIVSLVFLPKFRFIRLEGPMFGCWSLPCFLCGLYFVLECDSLG